MKESKKHPGSSRTDPDPAYAPTDPAGEPDPVREASTLEEDVLRAAREFSHLDRETATRAARIVNAYERDHGRVPETPPLPVEPHGDPESIGVFVDAFQRAKPVMHDERREERERREQEAELLPGVRILAWDEDRQRAAIERGERAGRGERRERPNSTPPDSPDAIRASRRGKALATLAADVAEAEAPLSVEAVSANLEPEVDGDRITHPSIHRRRERRLLVVLVAVAVVLGAIAWVLLKGQ